MTARGRTPRASSKAGRRGLPLPLKHVRHEHRGFRGGEIRNRGIRASAGEICIFLDGDCLAPADFIAAHRRLAEPGWFVTGNRILLSRELTDAVLAHRISRRRRWNLTALLQQRLRGGINRLLPTLRLPLGPLRKLNGANWEGAQTCNLAVARRDLDRIDGFDCAYTGWGLEDSDLVVRLLRAGVRRKDGRFATGVLHLWHPPNDRSQLPVNQARLDEVIGGTPHARLARAVHAERRQRALVARQCIGGATMKPLRLPESPRVLVVALRRLGDVLLTTPLIRSVKRAFPQASIDALVFAGTEGILTGNPDLAECPHAAAAPARRRNACADAAALQALRPRAVDADRRPADLPGRRCGTAKRRPVEANGVAAAVKRFALSRSYVSDRDQHRVLDILRLAELIGIPAHAEIVCPAAALRVPRLRRRSLTPSIHAAPMFIYKRWTLAGWRALAAALARARPRHGRHRRRDAIAPISMTSGATAMSCVSTASSTGRNCPP